MNATNLVHGFLGFGTMGTAIYHGLKTNYTHTFVYTSRTNRHTEIPSVSSIPELIAAADIIWLCTKPQQFPEAGAVLRQCDMSGKLVISVMAGVSLQSIAEFVGEGIAIVRLMPNLAITYGASVTAYSQNDVPHVLAKEVAHWMEKLGIVIPVPEHEMHACTALFGSGPAFLLRLLESVQLRTDQLKTQSDAFSTRDMLVTLLSGTLQYLDANPQLSLTELVSGITSKGGTTEAGLRVFNTELVAERFDAVLEAAVQRSIALSES